MVAAVIARIVAPVTSAARGLRGRGGAVSVPAMLRRPLVTRLRLVHVLALGLALAGGAVSCKKSSDGGSASPGGEGGGGGSAASAGVTMRYKPGAFKLKQNAVISVSIGGAQSGSFKVDAVGLLDVSDQAGKLKVAHSILEVRDVKLEGVLRPQPKDGKAPPDPKTEILKATGASLVDLRGETDVPGTKALPENKKEAGQDDDFSALGDFLGLPQLPEPALTVGKPLKQEKQEEQTLGGTLKIPTDEETTYTLVKIDEVDGKRLAELKIESESSGATEAQGTTISVDSVTEGTIVFDLVTQLPVKVHIEQTQNFSFGSQGSGESRVVIDSTYEPG